MSPGGYSRDTQRLSVEAVPQFNLRHLVLQRPLELPEDCERVHHAFRADDDVGVALLLGEDVVFAFCSQAEMCSAKHDPKAVTLTDGDMAGVSGAQSLMM